MTMGDLVVWTAARHPSGPVVHAIIEGDLLTLCGAMSPRGGVSVTVPARTCRACVAICRELAAALAQLDADGLGRVPVGPRSPNPDDDGDLPTVYGHDGAVEVL